MPPQRMQVFVSYSHRDRDAVRALYLWLVEKGVEAWFDEESLLPGQDWEYEIKRAIRASDIVLVCPTPHAINKSGYLQAEIRHALDAAERKPEGAVYIIPVRLEPCDVPERLSRWHWVDDFAPRGRNRLLLQLCSALKSPISPEHLVARFEDAVSVVSVSESEDDHRALRGYALPGWNVRSARTIDDTIRAVSKRICGVVVCRERVGGGDWRQMLSRLGAFAVAPSLVAFAEKADDRFWAEVLKAGAFDVLQLPFDGAEVVRVIQLAWLGWRSRWLPQRKGK